ncbi:response regulator receiver domain-containing protein [Flavobacterium chryseum]|uniref:response regulator n=1 Tax=Flavobacterium sp. P3160 TaxID=2512113 RepID=UPI00106122C7|nr:response regulator [Flavobacterium sp. P3160]TDO69957.1 response regulator receiver domain-containing protein [Flavobacterium sp. P3160]
MEFKPVFLLIDDNLIDQLVTKQLIKKTLDADLIIANNGEEGIQWLYNHQNLKSLIILLDIQMPIMNGFGFLSEYDKLSEEFKKEIHIYVLSSTLDADEIKQIEDNNYVTDFLSKPLPIEEFKKKIYLS